MEQMHEMPRKKQGVYWGALILNLAIPLAVGGLSALLTRGSMQEFEALEKPPLSPPGWAFPVVWTLLFVLMGISTYFVWVSHSNVKEPALALYAIQLFVNFFWSILFFNLTHYLLAFFWLLFLLILLFFLFYYFWRVKPLAAYLQIPYMLWVTFAGYLNLGIYLLNQ